MAVETDREESEIRELARSLNCITESDLCVLGGILPSTAEAWRKRGTGPAHIVFGRSVLYPRDGLADFLRTKTRAPRRVAPKDLL